MENKKSNQQRLKEYLVGEKGYLKSDISNGKVIMLSGKWGSGKTFFWQNKIQTGLNDENKKIPNHYISLYGKTSIQEIKNEVFLKIFESMDIFKIDDKSFGLAKNTANLVADLTKTVSVFGFNLDLSKIVDKSFEKLEKVREEKTEKKTEEILNSGAVICFDDFERKSKDIDLNDLFGFITHLAIEFKCKVVIILNDDVFEGEEKKIFSNVKEKSVSKFLKYEPSIKDLFDSIFGNDERYRKLDDYEKITLSTIEETQELNARIYIQVLDNLVEWIGKNQETDENILRCLILVNINFILYHTILCREKPKDNKKNFYIHYIGKLKDWEFDYYWINWHGMPMADFDYVVDNMKDAKVVHPENFEKYVIRLKDKKTNKNDREERVKEIKEFIEDNLILFKSDYFANKLDISKDVDDKTIQKINNFIETGILINE
ncbi:MAG: KAP family NTPase [Campylobacterales bacterium]|nr:KAP family NTPase [Campylobacterales bacterium]